MNGSSSGNLDDKPRLSEHEKKANHIASGTSILSLIAVLCSRRFHVRYEFVTYEGQSQSKNDDKPFEKVSIG